jgi:hypothetical protein
VTGRRAPRLLSAYVPAQLLVLQDFIDNGFSTLVHGDHFVDGSVAAEGDVDDVVAGIEHKVDGRVFIQHVLVHRNLSTSGLSLDADTSHTLSVFAAEKLFHFPDGSDVVNVAERA